jgi:hypothetical protein
VVAPLTRSASGALELTQEVELLEGEIVGGLILSKPIDPEAPHLGYIACSQVDLLTGNGTSCTPQAVRVDADVYQHHGTLPR